MDRNQLIGIVLMLAVLTAYFIWFAPEPPTPSPPSEKTNISTEKSEPAEKQPEKIDSATLVKTYGSLAEAKKSNEKEFLIENDDVALTFSSKGGRITSAKLKNYVTYDGDPLYVLDKNRSEIKWHMIINDKEWNLNEFHFQVEESKQSDTIILVFTLPTGSNQITQTYAIPSKGFQIFYSLNTQTSEGIKDTATLYWRHNAPLTDKDLQDARTKTTIGYHNDKGYDELNETSTSSESDYINETTNWLALKQNFFSAAWISPQSIAKAQINSSVNALDSSTTKSMQFSAKTNIKQLSQGSSYYFGPNHQEYLKPIAPEFGRIQNLGWSVLRWVNKGFIMPLFHILESFISNYGLSILLLVIVIRIILAPLTYSSHISMAKMKVLKPEIDAIKEKYGDDMQKTQTEQMDLYRKVGINPLSGCIPVVLQIPILFSLFYFFPNAIELRQKSFLWAEDLSIYDSIISMPFNIPFFGSHISLFTLLMTASTIVYTYMNSQVSTLTGPMKTMQYIMPVMFLFVLNRYAAGLTYYYFLSNILSIGQTFIFRKLVDEDKLKLAMEENRKKNQDKKKTKFQTRLEEAMKASEEAKKKKK